MMSTPSSVSFCTTHSGRSPFTGVKPTVDGAVGTGSSMISPSTVRELGEPGGTPAAVTVADRDRLSVDDAAHRSIVMEIPRREVRMIQIVNEDQRHRPPSLDGHRRPIS